MNPLGVLTASDVMQRGETNAAVAVDCELPVREVMDLLANGVSELAVIRHGVKIGVINAASLMGRLLNPRHG
jgi:signal-transduction protein with cAMP-binding, CBS, and nucleotidyltransferase domain